jgi:hypothetical protein
MGEAALLSSRARPLTREIAAAAFAEFTASGGEERFDVVYLTGWAPHESQQKPLRPGSARRSLESAIKKRS